MAWIWFYFHSAIKQKTKQCHVAFMSPSPTLHKYFSRICALLIQILILKQQKVTQPKKSETLLSAPASAGQLFQFALRWLKITFNFLKIHCFKILSVMWPLHLVYENKVARDQQFVEVKHKKLKEGTDAYCLCGQTKRRDTEIWLRYALAKHKRASQSLDQRQTGGEVKQTRSHWVSQAVRGKSDRHVSSLEGSGEEGTVGEAAARR